MKQFRMHVFFLLLLTGLALTLSPQAVATEATEMAMSIKAILPENQKKGVSGYFNLQVNPEDKQTIYIEIKNNKNEDILVNVTPTNAYSQTTGGIFYDVSIDSPDTAIIDPAFALSRNISAENEVVVKANETIEVPIEITVPNMNKGTIIGGVLIEEMVAVSEQTSETLEKDTAQFKVITKTAYAIAIQLDFPEQGDAVFSFGKAGFNAVGPNLYIEMLNDAPIIQREISGAYKVTDENGQALFSGDFEPIIMAPKTKINFPINWDSATLEPGKYTLSITADVAGEEMLVEEDFEINNDSVQEYSERTNQSVVQNQGGMSYWVVIAAVMLAVIASVGLTLWFVKRKK